MLLGCLIGQIDNIPPRLLLSSLKFGSQRVDVIVKSLGKLILCPPYLLDDFVSH